MGLCMLQYLFLLVQWVCLYNSVSSSWSNGFVCVTVSLPLGTMGLSLLQGLSLFGTVGFFCVIVSLPLGTMGLSMLQYLFLLVQ